MTAGNVLLRQIDRLLATASWKQSISNLPVLCWAVAPKGHTAARGRFEERAATMFYAQWSRRDVRPRDPATHRLRVDARAIAPPEPREDDATNADGCRFRDSFKYTEGASFKVGDCVMVQLEGEGVREGESLRHAAAQILQIWWPAPEEDEDEDEPWAEVRWLYCAEEIVPAKRRPTPAAKYPDREVFETTPCRRGAGVVAHGVR